MVLGRVVESRFIMLHALYFLATFSGINAKLASAATYRSGPTTQSERSYEVSELHMKELMSPSVPQLLTTRRALQTGISRGHTGRTSCHIEITGTGNLFGIASARMSCDTSSDRYWQRQPFNGRISLSAGRPLYNLYKKKPKDWPGVYMVLAKDPYSPSQDCQEPVIFFVGSGKVSLSGYVRNVSVRDWAITHIESGSDVHINNFEYSKNKGVRFPTVASARSTVLVTNSKFISNTCTSVTRCHTPGVYVTEGSRATVRNTLFKGNAGHLAGSIMVTSGALATIEDNVFNNNFTPNYGDFGGAIFHDFCDKDKRTQGGRSYIRNNKFLNNESAGFGGAIRLGSSDGGCPKTVVSNNYFQGNTAKIIGGAIHIAYCHGVRPDWTSNKFVNNVARLMPGQLAFNPTTYAKGQQRAGSQTGGGCPQPLLKACTFSTSSVSSNQRRLGGRGRNNRFAAPWYFP